MLFDGETNAIDLPLIANLPTGTRKSTAVGACVSWMISCVRACVCVYLQYDTMYQLQTESQELRNNIEQFSHSATKEDASALRRAVNSLLKQNDEASEEAQPGGNSGSVYMTRSSSTRTRAKTMSRQEAIERVNSSNDTGRASRSRDSTDSTQATMTSKQPAAREIGQSATAPLRVSSVLSWSANMGGGSPRGSTGTTNIQHYHAAATVRLEVGMISDSSMVFLDSVFFAVSALSFSHCLLVCLSAVPGLETGELVRKVNNLELELSSMTGKLDALISKARALARRNVLCTPPNCKLPPHPNTMKGIDWALGQLNTTQSFCLADFQVSSGTASSQATALDKLSEKVDRQFACLVKGAQDGSRVPAAGVCGEASGFSARQVEQLERIMRDVLRGRGTSLPAQQPQPQPQPQPHISLRTPADQHGHPRASFGRLSPDLSMAGVISSDDDATEDEEMGAE